MSCMSNINNNNSKNIKAQKLISEGGRPETILTEFLEHTSQSYTDISIYIICMYSDMHKYIRVYPSIYQ
jgi:hypothetical protein